MKHVIETSRLYLRELCINDSESLSIVLSDPESMKYYPHEFDLEKVRTWISWNIDNYRTYQHGLWAAILKEENVFLGDCGITMQDIEGTLVPEIGYHIRKDYCNKGYATEAAKSCIDYAFNVLNYNEVFSYTKTDNQPSIKVAINNGMHFVKYFDKEINGLKVHEVLYSIKR